MPVALAAWLLAMALGGCFLPLGTAAPQSARTVGDGNVGVSMYAEFPTVDLVATGEEQNPEDDDYAFAPLPTATLAFGYGLNDDLDIEAGIDTTLWIVIPVPMGLWAGGRMQLADTDDIAVTLAGRLGFVGSGDSDDEDSDGDMTASYANVSIAAQLMPWGLFRPVAAISVVPAWVTNNYNNDTPENFTALTTSFTMTALLALGPLELGPFVNLVHFRSPNFRGTTSFVTGGVVLSLRSRKSKREAPITVTPPQ